MNLVVDVGNTRLKYAFFSSGKLQRNGTGAESMFRGLEAVREQGEPVDVLLSGSGKIGGELRGRLQERAAFWLEASARLALPVKIGYTTPETLGFDRIAVAVAARKLFPSQDLLVIDSGTALTFNYIEGGVLLGGNISPGVEMRFKALHLFTEKLPLVEPSCDFGLYGQDTPSAIREGVMNGMLFEIEGYIQRFCRRGKKAQVLITGGNSRFLESRLKNKVYFDETLGVKGLNEILEFNKNVN